MHVYVAGEHSTSLDACQETSEEDAPGLIRETGNLHVLFDDRSQLAKKVAQTGTGSDIDLVTKQRPDGLEQFAELRHGKRPVHLRSFEGILIYLVVAHGSGKKLLMIRTTEPRIGSRKFLWWSIEAYLTRGRIEDSLRFAKQSDAIEDLRVLGYESLRRMMAPALLAIRVPRHEPGDALARPEEEAAGPASALRHRRQAALRHPGVPLRRDRRQAGRNPIQAHRLRVRVERVMEGPPNTLC